MLSTLRAYCDPQEFHGGAPEYIESLMRFLAQLRDNRRSLLEPIGGKLDVAV